jgi:branched-chain amino acid transport system permease protein
MNVLQILLNGLSTSATYVMFCLGLTLAFGVARIMNFAHGELYMLGAYVVWILWTVNHINFLLASLISLIVLAALGIVFERFLFKPVRNNQMSGFLVAVGLGFILQVVIGQGFGIGDPKPVGYAYLTVLRFAGASMSVHRLILIVACVVFSTLLLLFLRRTLTGQAMRAFVQDSRAASLQGININFISGLAMAIAAAFAGLAGGLISPMTEVQPYMGGTLILKAFMIIIVGGVGSIEGTLIAAIFFGFFDSTFASFDAIVGNMVGLSLAVVVLMIRPKGIFGRD